jgi:hypothetical protein
LNDVLFKDLAYDEWRAVVDDKDLVYSARVQCDKEGKNVYHFVQSNAFIVEKSGKINFFLKNLF